MSESDLGAVIAQQMQSSLAVKFVDTALAIYVSQSHNDPPMKWEDALDAVELAFARAGISLPGFEQRGGVRGPLYEQRGRPPRGALILLKESWDSNKDIWKRVAVWSEATRLALVTSEKEFPGRRGVDGKKLPSFNARPAYGKDCTTFKYSAQRFYLEGEGITWRWTA